jgi:hypothetical protein
MTPQDFEVNPCNNCGQNDSSQVYAASYKHVVGLCNQCIDTIGAPLNHEIFSEDIVIVAFTKSPISSILDALDDYLSSDQYASAKRQYNNNDYNDESFIY